MVPGDHGTTYGGNPLVCAAANAVLDVFKEKNIVGHVQEVGAYLWEKLEEIVVSSGSKGVRTHEEAVSKLEARLAQRIGKAFTARPQSP